jgi:serine/threonine protein kinase
MKAVMSLDAGTTLGRYELLERAGAGGMGEVYRARDPKLDRIVALKMLPPDVARDELRMQRFVQEAKTLQR